jgi:hypothetical protein
MSETVSSLEATDREKALVEDLSPWPLSNEEAWAVARKHLGDLELGYRIYRREAAEYETKLHKIDAAILEHTSNGVGAAETLRQISLVLLAEPSFSHQNETSEESEGCCPEEEV